MDRMGPARRAPGHTTSVGQGWSRPPQPRSTTGQITS